MTYEHLIQAVQSHGFGCTMDSTFDYYCDLVGSQGRVLCCNIHEGINGLWPTNGLILSVQIGGAFSLVTTFGGVNYWVRNPAKLPSIICSSLKAAPTGIHSIIPTKLVRRFGLTEVELASAAGDLNIEWSKCAVGAVEEIVDPKGGILQAFCGNDGECVGVIRKASATGCRTTTIAFVNSVRHSPDHLAFLSNCFALVPTLQYATWDTSIDLSDPYYSPPSNLSRPASPKRILDRR